MVDGKKTPVGGYQFADIGYDRYYGGIGYLSMATPDVSWEISTKQDLGIDFSFFEDKISGSIDYYNEKRTGIYLERRHLPWTVGLSAENYKKEKQNVSAMKGSIDYCLQKFKTVDALTGKRYVSGINCSG